MDVVTLVRLCLIHFHLDAMRIGPRVLTDAGDLPGNFNARFAGFDGEAAAGNLCGDPGLGGLADGCELIAKIRIESLKPRGHTHDGRAAPIGDDRAVVDVLHVGRFDEGVVQILIGGVEWMIDLKRAARFADGASGLHVAQEKTGGTEIGAMASFAKYRDSPLQRSRSAVCVDTVASERAPARHGIVSTGGSDACAPDNAEAVASISYYATATNVICVGALSPKRSDTRSSGAGHACGATVGRPAVSAHSRASDIETGQRQCSGARNCSVLWRGVGYVEDRRRDARAAP